MNNTRQFLFTQGPIDQKARTVELSFSSESPVDRGDHIEVLDHGVDAVDLARLSDGAAVLFEHDSDRQIGVVQKAWVDADRKGRAILRFSRSKFAREIWADIVDGIRKFASVGYTIAERKADGKADGYRGTVPIMRAMRWTPHEISIVGTPADTAAAIGRADPILASTAEENPAVPEFCNIKEKTMTQPQPAVDIITAHVAVGHEANARAEAIAEIGAKHSADAKAVLDFIRTGKSVEDFKTYLIEAKSNAVPLNAQKPDEVGMSRRELQSYSLMRAIRARARGEQLEGLELEVARDIEKRAGTAPRGFYVPQEVFKRDLTTGNSGSAIALNIGEFVSPLLADSVAVALGATVYNNLSGNVSIPKGGSATGYWLAENAATTESSPSLGQVLLSPKRVAGFVDLSKTLLSQSSIDVESQTRLNLVKQLSLAIDRAAISGSGAGGEPTGIINTAGIGTVTAPSIDRDVVVDLEAAVAEANALDASAAYLMTHTIKGTLKKTSLGAASGRFVMEGSDLNGYKALSSTQATGLVFGSFANLIIASFGAMDVLVDPYSQVSGNLIRIHVQTNADIGVKHAAAFAKYVA